MKKIKFTYLLLIILLISCENNKIEIPNQSTSAKVAMQELQKHFNSDGSLDNTNNPVGNIVFDYCFDFQLPITLSYNSGETVVVNNFEYLVDILISMTEVSYVNGIIFPFNVESYENTGAIVVRIINNEQEFSTLIESCNFDDDSCIFTQEDAPVCAKIRAPSGENFTIKFPNISYAICENFRQNDLVDCDDYNEPGNDTNYFRFNYPISIIDLDENTIEISHTEEWDNVLYYINGFDFVYPFDVTLLENQQVQTITNEEDYILLLIARNNLCEVVIPAPILEGGNPLELCGNEETLADIALFVTGIDLIFWDTATDGNQLPQTTIVVDSMQVWVSQGTSNCAERLLIDTLYEEMLSPIAESPMRFCTANTTLADVALQVIGNNLTFWDAQEEGGLLPETTLLFHGQRIWVSQGTWICANRIMIDIKMGWKFVYPVTFINGAGDSVTINNDLEFDAQFDLNTSSLVYPFSVIIEDVISVIGTSDDFINIEEFENRCD